MEERDFVSFVLKTSFGGYPILQQTSVLYKPVGATMDKEYYIVLHMNTLRKLV